jgi:hypothetical protein
MLKFLSKQNLLIILSFCSLIYIAFFLTFKLSVLPGLHGDEAWIGLKANDFSKNGINQLTGMNNYTGILQVLLCESIFKLFGIGIFQLRIGGAILNLIGLSILATHLLVKKDFKCLFVYLGIISQSVIYLCSPRVAWEVNSFTLFLISLLFVCVIKLWENKKDRRSSLITFFFLFVNIVGTYNHIIFSCISVSAFTCLIIWNLYNQSLIYQNFLLLSAINLINVIIVFVLMHYVNGTLLRNIHFLLLGLVILLLGELKLYDFLKKRHIRNFFNFKQSKIIASSFLITCIISYTYIHGESFFDTITGYNILLQNYSYECPLLFRIILTVSGALFLLFLMKFIWRDLDNRHYSLPVFFIITYIGVINLFTRDTSYRYYLAIYLFVVLYLAFKISSHLKKSLPLIFSLLVSFCLINIIQYNIFTNQNRPVKAIKFIRSVDQTETSEHFLPKEPILQYIAKNKIGKINCLTDNCYFIEKPIAFYRLILPWQENPNNIIELSYDFNQYGTGYIIKKIQ